MVNHSVYWPAHQRRQQTSSKSSVSWMLPHESSPTHGSLITVWRTSDAKISIGWMSLTASNTDYASTFTLVCTAWHHSTCLAFVRRLQKFRNDDVFALLIMDNSIPQGSSWQPSEDIRSPALHRPHGTLYQTDWKTLLHLVSFSETVWKLFFFPPT